MQHLVSIQILRALAALAVAFGHAAHEASLLAARQGQTFTAPWQALSATGVDLFFAISGFVMVLSSARLFATPEGRGVFVRRRLARIVPVYWVATSLFLLVMLATPGAVHSAGASGLDILRSYLFIPYQRSDSGLIQPVYGLGWTLNYEMFFYTLFALVIGLRAGAAVAVLGLGLGGIVLAGLVFPDGPAVWRFWSDPIVLEFAAGAGVGLAALRGVRLPPVVSLALIGIGVMWFAAANASGDMPLHLDRLWRAGLPLALVMAGAALRQGDAPAHSASRLLAALGDASYALYLFHPMVVRGLGLVWGRLGLPGGWLYLAVTLGLSALLGVMIYRWFERPVTQMLQRAAR